MVGNVVVEIRVGYDVTLGERADIVLHVDEILVNLLTVLWDKSNSYLIRGQQNPSPGVGSPTDKFPWTKCLHGPIAQRHVALIHLPSGTLNFVTYIVHTRVFY